MTDLQSPWCPSPSRFALVFGGRRDEQDVSQVPGPEPTDKSSGPRRRCRAATVSNRSRGVRCRCSCAAARAASIAWGGASWVARRHSRAGWHPTRSRSDPGRRSAPARTMRGRPHRMAHPYRQAVPPEKRRILPALRPVGVHGWAATTYRSHLRRVGHAPPARRCVVVDPCQRAAGQTSRRIGRRPGSRPLGLPNRILHLATGAG